MTARSLVRRSPGLTYTPTALNLATDMSLGKDESFGAHALRYLSTLRAWHIAARSVIMLVRKAYEIRRTPGVSLVRLRDRPNEAIDDVRRNGQAIIDSLNAQIAAEYTSDSQEGKLVAQWMEKNCRIPERIGPFRVHSEAGLMAMLMIAEANPGDLGDGIGCRSTVCCAPRPRPSSGC